MYKRLILLVVADILMCSSMSLRAQVYTPLVMTPRQIDTTNLSSLAQSIYRNAGAVTDREKAESIWRFYLTDGRFVKPGIFYHIPGWAYEEPVGEVLDPIKLLNSYGFGLCYQDAPLLQATWDAGGFRHTRVWFLTGHSVAEVFYDGQYHYYDSDMMGYTTLGDGPVRTSPVASVQQLQTDRSILLTKLDGPNKVKADAVDSPWYNADVRAGAISNLADLFSTSDDNYVYGYARYSHGHTMDFVLRPGERMIRYYNQDDPGIRYLPYKTDGKEWKEFPQDVGGTLLVKNGPHSEKDSRRWSTGLIEYQPTDHASRVARKNTQTPNQAVYDVSSPYVIIGAKFSMQASLFSAGQSLTVETSRDAGHTWTAASTLRGPFSGAWTDEPSTLAQSTYGTLNAVAGTYGYLVRFTLQGLGEDLAQGVKDLKLSTTFEFNPRTLPEIAPGTNVLNYGTANVKRVELPIHAGDAKDFAETSMNVELVSQGGQDYLRNATGSVGQLIFNLALIGKDTLTGFDVGGRFLELGDGLAPDKLTAEVRKITPWPVDKSARRAASIAWALKPDGPWTKVWNYNPDIAWPDKHIVKRILRWPEVDRSVRHLKTGSKSVYVRYRFQNIALDDIRLATIQKALPTTSMLTVTHVWSEEGKQTQFVKQLSGGGPKTYSFKIPNNSSIHNQALIFSVH